MISTIDFAVTLIFLVTMFVLLFACTLEVMESISDSKRKNLLRKLDDAMRANK